MKLVVGLGNPGARYDRTRHNIGFAVVDRLSEQVFADPPREKFHGVVREARLGSELVLLLKPLTFMNVSGKSVAAAAGFYRLEPEQILVLCDDFALPLGTLRLRPGGSAGGQNGLKDVTRQLGTDAVPRLRLGIGPVPGPIQPADFVLGRFTEDEQVQVDSIVAQASEAVRVWVASGLTDAMNRFNTAREAKPRESRTSRPGRPQAPSPGETSSGSLPSGDRASRPRPSS